MTLCTQLPPEERCPGCPLDSFKRPLEPHEELAFTTEVNGLLSLQEPDATKETYLSDVTRTMLQLEPAVTHLGWLVNQAAVWRLVGGCEHHDGLTIEEPEEEKRKRELKIIDFVQSFKAEDLT